MKLEVLQEFHDAKADVIRKQGDILTVSEARGNALLNFGMGLVRLAAEEPKEAEKKATDEAPKPKRRSNTKKN